MNRSQLAVGVRITARSPFSGIPKGHGGTIVAWKGQWPEKPNGKVVVEWFVNVYQNFNLFLIDSELQYLLIEKTKKK